MKFSFERTAALAVGLLLCHAATLHAAQQRNYQLAGATAEAADSAVVSYNSVESYTECESCDAGCPSNLGWGKSRFVRSGQFFVGAEYLNVRSTFSEATSYIRRTVFTNGSIQNEFVPLDFDYESSYRFYGGYRFSECGEEIIFAYSRYTSEASSDANVPTNLPQNVASESITAPSGDVSPGANGRLLTDANVEANSYDLAFAKTIPVCSCYCQNSCDPCCGDGCDSCADSCCGCGSGCGNCCPCPAWAFTWFAGVRFADVNWSREAATVETNPLNNESSNAALDFEGIGPRVGLAGRRYIGRRQILSLYARSDVSLLLGDVNIVTNFGVNPAGDPALISIFNNTQLFPVLDIEAGGTLQVTENITMSAGYLFSAWFDLGMRDTVDALAANGGPFWDDSNILGFDGFFARTEVAF